MTNINLKNPINHDWQLARWIMKRWFSFVFAVALIAIILAAFLVADTELIMPL